MMIKHWWLWPASALWFLLVLQMAGKAAAAFSFATAIAVVLLASGEDGKDTQA